MHCAEIHSTNVSNDAFERVSVEAYLSTEDSEDAVLRLFYARDSMTPTDAALPSGGTGGVLIKHSVWVTDRVSLALSLCRVPCQGSVEESAKGLGTPANGEEVAAVTVPLAPFEVGTVRVVPHRRGHHPDNRREAVVVCGCHDRFDEARQITSRSLRTVNLDTI